MSIKFQSFETNNGGRSFGNQTSTSKLGQGFKHTAQVTIDKISLLLYKLGTPTDNVTCEIQQDDGSGLPNGTIVATASNIAMTGITTSTAGAWYDFTFSTPPVLQATVQYHVVMGRSGALNNGNNPVVKVQTTDGYADGALGRYDSGTSSWIVYGGDANFQVWGGSIEIESQYRYDLNGVFAIEVTSLYRYDVLNVIETQHQYRYDILREIEVQANYQYDIFTNIEIQLGSRYDIFTNIEIQLGSRYDIIPAFMEWWYDINDNIIPSLRFLTLSKGQISSVTVLHLWNSRGDTTALTMSNCKLTTRLSNKTFAGGTDLQGQEAVTGKWVEVKSSGISGTGITDDAQTTFTPVGGDPNVSGNFLSIGNIPPNTARHIHVRVNVPAAPTTSFSAFPELLISYDMA